MNTAPVKYRKKPVQIEAWEWDGTWEEGVRIIEWIDSATLAFPVVAAFTGEGEGPLETSNASSSLHIQTLEGVMTASPGDFIIRGVQGEFYPCKPDIFAATYDTVQDDR